jgi:hypothetical protein
MARFRLRRLIGPTIRFVLVVVAGVLAARFLFTTLLSEGLSPAAVFGFLVFAATVALSWRAVLHLRKSIRRART